MKNYHSKEIAHVTSVEIRVLDLKRSIDFYTKTIGMKIIKQDNEYADFGVNTNEILLRLVQINHGHPKEARTAGLYHVAYLLPTRKDLGLILKHFIELRTPLQGASNHGISEAIYLADPDGNGIEIAADTPDSTWKWNGDKLDILSDNGPMDIQSVLNETNDSVFEGLPESTIVGHLHLHASELVESKKFYRDILGLDIVIEIPNSAIFMSYGKYHHHIAINLWNGKGVKQASSMSPGLIIANLWIPTLTELSTIESTLKHLNYPYIKKDQSLIVNDPSGNQFRLSTNS
jgi:catechol 2,3-dioxygenase